MFAVIYSFKIKPGMEDIFQSAWAQRTQEIKDTLGGLGSRLHRNLDDQSFIAYAQWPSREAWESSSSVDTEAQVQMRQAIADFSVLHKLEVLKDLLDVSSPLS